MQAFGFSKNMAGFELFSPDEIIFQAGETGNCMYVILEGTVNISVQGRIIDKLTDGNIVGEMALIDAGVRSASATAVTRCKLLPVNKARFAELVQQYPTFALHVMTIMSERLRRLMVVEVQRQRMEEELKIGRDMQLSLLPKHVPTIPGWEFAAYYQAARQVGGDLYDFIPSPQDPNRLNLVVADVTSKGVPAALFMASVRSVIRAITLNDRAPDETLRRANRFVVQDIGSKLFISIFYASLNTQTGQVAYANGGHEWPLWWQHSTQTITHLDTSGLLLGAFPDINPTQHEITLAPGDCLILFTDGVTEARTEDGTFFEDERFQNAIAASAHLHAEEIVAAVVTAVAQFTGSTPQSDDLTLVVAKYLGK
ncbi:MAG: SpoIIE family protein phosphatase [Anaerolineales bacterium]|nr:SpoIIE family protein phosphatase [Anaerolineales bacterium]